MTLKVAWTCSAEVVVEVEITKKPFLHIRSNPHKKPFLQ
jgi:hypothetical protein